MSDGERCDECGLVGSDGYELSRVGGTRTLLCDHCLKTYNDLCLDSEREEYLRRRAEDAAHAADPGYPDFEASE